MYPLLVVRRINRDFLWMRTRENEFPGPSRFDTMKVPLCSKAGSAESSIETQIYARVSALIMGMERWYTVGK